MSSRLRLDLADLRYSARTIMVALVRVEELRPLTLVTARSFPLPPRSSASLSRLLLDPVAALGDWDDPNWRRIGRRAEERNIGQVIGEILIDAS